MIPRGSGQRFHDNLDTYLRGVLCDYAKAFLKDWERLTRSGRFDMNCLTDMALTTYGIKAIIYACAGP